MKTDFKALCAELMDAIDSGIPVERIKQSPLAVRVDAALAQPEPVAPSDDELLLMACMTDLVYDTGCGAFPSSFIEGTDITRETLAVARAVRARWARPAIEPVPVSERLPGEGDCDAEGRCWWWIVDQPGELPHWIYCQLEVLSWTNFTAWLPHHALPVPGAEVGS